MQKYVKALSFLVLSLIGCAAVTALPEQACADTIRGFIQHQANDGAVLLLTKTGNTGLKITASPALMVDLQNLKDGDYIVGRGTVQMLPTPSLTMEALDTVGLAELIGSWRSATWEIFEFRDFTQLNCYKPLNSSNGPALAKTNAFNYVLAPETGDRYSIFLSDNRSVHVGTIEIHNGVVGLVVYDSKTGAVSQNISLSPLGLQ